MTEQNELKSLLERKRQDLLSEIRSYASQLAIQESENDPLDRVLTMTGRDQAATMIETLSCTLLRVDGALNAISQGTYGTCLDCEEPIAIKRLKTIPWASRCVHCQELLDTLQTATAA